MLNIVPYDRKDPELWDEERQMPLRAYNDRPVRIKQLDAIAILAPMFALFPNAKMSEMAVEQYLRLLQDLSPVDLQAAIDTALEGAEWLPTVAAIRKGYIRNGQNARQLRQFVPEDDGRDWDKIEWVVARPTKEERMTRLRETRRPGDRI